MGFLFGKKKLSGNGSQSGGASVEYGGKHADEGKSPRRRQRRHHQIIKKMVLRTGSSKKSNTSTVPATPANALPTARATPATTLIGYEPDSVQTKQHYSTAGPKSETKEFEIHYRDTVSHSVLEEQERIRQQLFYEEEGVEVTAQFQTSARHTSLSQQQSTLAVNQKIHNEEEEKKDDTSPLSLPKTPESTNKENSTSSRESGNDSPPLPETPSLDDSETDPAKHFPAIAAAMAKAKEAQEMKRNASLAAASTSTASSSVATSIAKSDGKPLSSSALVTPVSPSPEKPFDEVAGREDPTIMEIENALSKENKEAGEHDVDDIQVDLFDAELTKGAVKPNVGCGNGSGAFGNDMEKTSRKLLDVFNCGDDFTEFSGSAMHGVRSCRLVDSFYDTSCWSYRDATNMKRPYYDELFTQRFLKDITEEGLNVLWHLPPSGEESQADSTNWSGRSVTMKIRPGSSYSTNDVEPKLVWTTMGGGINEKKMVRCLIPLLKIKSVSTFRDSIGVGDEVREEEQTGTSCGINLSRMDDDDVCLFSITTEEGDVQVFEAASPRERDVFVTGLRNVIARLSFHVIVGDAGASSELYYEEDKNPPQGELPSFSNPVQNMNRIAHALLD